MNWHRWIRPGLAATILMTLIALVVRSGAIGRDLAAEVNARLAAEGQVWATAEGAARDVTIRGTAPSPESQQAVVRLAQGVRGVHAVSDRTDLLPLVSPYQWSAKRAGRLVTLSGAVPSEGSRGAVLAAARRAMPKAEIVDQMAPARGAPTAFGPATTFALARLAEFGEGTVSLTDSTLVVTGVALDAATYAAAREALQQDLPASVVLGPVDVEPERADPFVWSANFDGTNVALAGFVPNKVVHESLVASIKATLPGAAVEDRVAIASGDPPGFAEAAGFAITVLDRLRSGGVTLDGLKLDVAGAAKSVDDYEALLASLSGPLPEGMQVVAAEVEPAPVSPYGWRAERADGHVVLTGYVPDPESQAEVVGLARSLFGGDAIESRVRVAAGEPRMDWVGAIKFALGQLALLSRGSVDLGDKTYAIEGEAASSDAFIAVSDVNTHKLPASLVLGKADVTPPRVSPFRFVAERKGNGVVLSGDVASAADRQHVIEAVQHKFGAVPIEDRLVFASGGPQDFGVAVDTAVQLLSRLTGGRIEIVDKALSLAGYTYYPAAVGEIADDLGGELPEGFTVAANAVAARQDDQPVTPAQCRDLLQKALQTGRIAFSGTKAALAADSIGVLDRISAIVARCPDAAVEIGAHSDSDGSASRNRDLTQVRADAIADYLVGAGVKRERLTAMGYGESKPIADNSTAAGKAANRRIEFTVTEVAGG